MLKAAALLGFLVAACSAPQTRTGADPVASDLEAPSHRAAPVEVGQVPSDAGVGGVRDAGPGRDAGPTAPGRDGGTGGMGPGSGSGSGRGSGAPSPSPTGPIKPGPTNPSPTGPTNPSPPPVPPAR